MPKYSLVQGNYHIHKKVTEASAKYVIEKEERHEEKYTEEQEYSSEYKSCLTWARGLE